MISSLQDRLYIISKKYGSKFNLDLAYFIKNGFWVTIRQIISACAGLAMAIVFTRLSTQEVFGQYQFILSLLAIISIISIPGLNTSLIQSVSRGYDGDYKETVRISFYWSLFGVPMFIILGIYYYFYQSQVLGISLMISSLFFPFFYSTNTWDSFLQGKKRFDIATLYASMQSTVSAVLIMIVVYLDGDNLISIVSIYLLAYSIINILCYYKSLRYINNADRDDDTVRYGYFITKMSIPGLVANNLDKIIIGAFISPSALAIYTVTAYLPLKLKDAVKPFSNLLLPKFSSLNENMPSIIKGKKKLIIVFIIINISVSIAYYFSIEKIDRIMFGENYQDYYHYSKYFFIVILLAVPLNVLSRYVFGVKDAVVIRLSNIMYPILRSIINIILIYKYAIIGAVIAYNLNFILLLLIYIFGLSISNKKKK